MVPKSRIGARQTQDRATQGRSLPKWWACLWPQRGRHQQEEFQYQIECWKQVFESLATQIRSWPRPRPPSPATLDCTGVADVRTVPAPVPAPRVMSARMKLASAPVPTPKVGAAGARQVPASVPLCYLEQS